MAEKTFSVCKNRVNYLNVSILFNSFPRLSLCMEGEEGRMRLLSAEHLTLKYVIICRQRFKRAEDREVMNRLQENSPGLRYVDTNKLFCL